MEFTSIQNGYNQKVFNLHGLYMHTYVYIYRHLCLAISLAWAVRKIHRYYSLYGVPVGVMSCQCY